VALNAATESVANLSFGLAPDEVGGYGQDPLNLATETLRYLGTNVVVSAGNTAGEVSDPGFDPRVITVGAADTRKGSPKLAPFSGSAVVAGVAKPDLVAPGVGMLGTLPPTSSIVAANPAALQSNGFYRGSGTSEATAVVSGLAALFVADHRSATTAQVKASLRAAASTIHARGSGAGLANVAERLARSRDDSKMGDAGALGEGNFDSSAWSNNGWGVSAWGSVWNHNRWGTGSWATQAWSQLSWAQNRWGSASWDYNRWGSDSWDYNRWGNNRWDNRWGTSTWDQNRWGADAWGSDYWGSDGGDDA
jgi:serine protease AprX